MATVMLASLIPLALIVRACNRGARIPGPSWFDIPHGSNRATRRARP